MPPQTGFGGQMAELNGLSVAMTTLGAGETQCGWRKTLQFDTRIYEFHFCHALPESLNNFCATTGGGDFTNFPWKFFIRRMDGAPSLRGRWQYGCEIDIADCTSDMLLSLQNADGQIVPSTITLTPSQIGDHCGACCGESFNQIPSVYLTLTHESGPTDSLDGVVIPLQRLDEFDGTNPQCTVLGDTDKFKKSTYHFCDKLNSDPLNTCDVDIPGFPSCHLAMYASAIIRCTFANTPPLAGFGFLPMYMYTDDGFGGFCGIYDLGTQPTSPVEVVCDPLYVRWSNILLQDFFGGCNELCDFQGNSLYTLELTH